MSVTSDKESYPRQQDRTKVFDFLSILLTKIYIETSNIELKMEEETKEEDIEELKKNE